MDQSNISILLVIIIILLSLNCMCKSNTSPFKTSSILDYSVMNMAPVESRPNAIDLMPIAGQSVRSDYFKNPQLPFVVSRDDSVKNVDSLDITGPMYWRNDPRDVVGLVQTAHSRTPLGDENEMQHLIDYEHGAYAAIY